MAPRTVSCCLLSGWSDQLCPQPLCREYLRALASYRQRIWGCKHTGVGNLSYEEALASEAKVQGILDQVSQYLAAYEVSDHGSSRAANASPTWFHRSAHNHFGGASVTSLAEVGSGEGEKGDITFPPAFHPNDQKKGLLGGCRKTSNDTAEASTPHAWCSSRTATRRLSSNWCTTPRSRRRS